ncbi:uncharacterized protein LOC110906932 [Helianthus annuus]|uniref:uncharacterized protein LOC110906932 n=1 Tax=Helianthus annuus TaxID=4232 RepID=UPI000B9061B7|nr:uncharacterized protein LOC110906932 [Helianthus annuus]
MGPWKSIGIKTKGENIFNSENEVAIICGNQRLEDREYWMYHSLPTSEIYIKGVSTFLKVAEVNWRNVGSKDIWCPCRICKTFQKYENIRDIEYHLIANGFMPSYTYWTKHGESRIDGATTSVNLENVEHDDFLYGDNLNKENLYDDNLNNDSLNDNNLDDMFNDLENDDIDDDDRVKLQHLFEDAQKPLYNGCEISKLEAVLMLFTLKAKNRWSDTSFTDVLVVLHDMLPNSNVYARKRKTGEYDNDVKKNGPPAKVMWYLPIIPRLKRLFSNEKEAKLLCWHSDERIKDGKLRHVADSPQWRNINRKYPEFGNEVRNIRFGLSSDGFNPFGNASSGHSTWPVLLCIYNLPPWFCMKRKYIMMSLLIQGPKQPGNNIDVYMSPLIDDLKTLWESGVNVYDAYKKEYFDLRAMIFCTISDFPAYANLSGYSTKEKQYTWDTEACPVCEDETSSRVDENHFSPYGDLSIVQVEDDPKTSNVTAQIYFRTRHAAEKAFVGGKSWKGLDMFKVYFRSLMELGNEVRKNGSEKRS